MGLQGMTSNPSIFEKAISKGTDYDKQITMLCGSGKNTFDIYDELSIKDIQDAADMFVPVHRESKGLDGYVSLEVDPRLSSDTDKTMSEARRLHSAVQRPNLMIKVPSTKEGFPAIEKLISEGINVNVTLIFSLQQYKDTIEAYLKGIESLIKDGGDPSTVRSVASVFVSRIDTVCDTILDEKTKSANTPERDNALSLKGKAAVSNCRAIYATYRTILDSERFKELQGKGANIQRVLWGSTSTKNPEYSDIKYISELIGKDTVNTVPKPTIEAFLDHGITEETLPGDIKEADDVIQGLKALGIDIDSVCADLLKKGVSAFESSFDNLLASIEHKISRLCRA
jgi:transaldolase/glucose-6-phosphate isomerase